MGVRAEWETGGGRIEVGGTITKLLYDRRSPDISGQQRSEIGRRAFRTGIPEDVSVQALIQ